MQIRLFVLCLFFFCAGCKKEVQLDQTKLYPVKIGKQYGYINASGEIAIEPSFFSVNWFNGDRAIVETAPGRKAMIDETGRLIFQDTTGFLHLEYQDGRVKFETKNQKSCFLDSLGITRFCLSDSVVFAESAFSCKRLLVRLQGGIFAYLNTDGQEVYRFRRGFPGNYSDDVVRRSFNGRSCYFNKNGKNLFCVRGPGGNFSNDRVLIEEKYNIYFVDKKGSKKISPLPYDKVTPFVNGFASIQKNKKLGFINTAGEVVIPLMYAQSGIFSSDIAAVQQDHKGKWKFINSRNELVIAKEFDEVAMPGFRGELAYVRQDSTWGYINKKGEFVWRSNQWQPLYTFPLLKYFTKSVVRLLTSDF